MIFNLILVDKVELGPLVLIIMLLRNEIFKEGRRTDEVYLVVVQPVPPLAEVPCQLQLRAVQQDGDWRRAAVDSLLETLDLLDVPGKSDHYEALAGDIFLESRSEHVNHNGLNVNS